MYTELKPVTLRSGEEVTAAVVQGPDADWADRICPMLQHKGEPWTWQNASVLTRDLGIDAYFYVLHRAGRPFANVMTIEGDGVGIFGHVWTDPADRRQGASSHLIRQQMDHFRRRSGRALYLGTGYGSGAYRIYARHGFESVEPASGYMAYVPAGAEAFEAQWFAADDESTVAVEVLDWRHWPRLQPLFLGLTPGIVRNAAQGLYGRAIAEEGPLHLIGGNERRRGRDLPATAYVLTLGESGAVVGLASWVHHPLWPESVLIDLFCHEAYWPYAGNLAAALSPPPDVRQVAYVAVGDHAQRQAYYRLGFRQVVSLPAWLTVDAAGSERADVLMLERPG